MPNKKLVSIRGVHNLLKSEAYQLYNEQKQQILNEYPPLKERSREENLQVMRRVCDLMWIVDGHFQQFIWEQLSEQDKLEQDRRADGRKQGGKRGPKPRNEEY